MLTIDNEFKKLLAPLLTEEREELERNILARGCLDPLKAWQGVLIDGHNRYEICTKHSLPYKVTELSFDDREDVIDWIIDNQIGRRNLTQQQTSYYRGVKQERLKKRGFKGNQYTESALSQNATKQNTAKTIAEQHGVDTATIYRDAAYARAVDAIAETAGEEVKQQILTGELPLTKKDVVTLAALPADEQREVISADRSVDGWRKTRDSLKFLSNVVNAHVETPNNPNSLIRGTFGTGENEWYTPAQYIEMARTVLGRIDLDPASSAIANETVKAASFFTSQENGLVQDWHGNIFLNPPYSQPAISQFADKMIDEWSAQRADAAIVLTHNYTDTAWFQKLAEQATAICFTRGRIRFISAGGDLASPTQGQAFFYFGPNMGQFVKEFSEIGFVVEVK